MKKKYQQSNIGDMVNFIAQEYSLDEKMLRAKLAINFPQLKDKSHCANCMASMESFWHDLSPGLVGSLIKAIEFVRSHNKNCFHLAKDLSLSKTEYNNFQKLRFHGLVAKDKEKIGYWLITTRGGQFLRNEMGIPDQVETFRNQVIGHSEKLVKISDFKHDFPKFQSEFAVNLKQGILL